MTPHNKAKKDDVAPVVIMCGDPLRAKWIAENSLQDAKLINDVRGMLGFTGVYGNKRITVMGHGMGIPSMGIYSYELFNFYDVETIIRVGSAGSYIKEINVGDVVIAKDAASYSTYASEIGLETSEGLNILPATAELVDLAQAEAKLSARSVGLCRAYSSDAFYNKYTLEENIKRSGNSSVVEMEAFALYANAIKLNKKSLTLLTCSDSFITHEELSANDRQTQFTDMVKLALDMAATI
jgi:purine-nucleoside phosphorylase